MRSRLTLVVGAALVALLLLPSLPAHAGQRQESMFKAPGSDAFVPAGPPVDVFDPRGYFEVEPDEQRSGTYRFSWRGLRSNAVGVYVG